MACRPALEIPSHSVRQKVRLTRSIRAVYAGLFANIVLPLRPGEVLRCFLLANSENIKVGRVLGSVGVERLVDLVIATASLGRAFRWSSSCRDASNGSRILWAW